jgi:hypothetical protein
MLPPGYLDSEALCVLLLLERHSLWRVFCTPSQIPSLRWITEANGMGFFMVFFSWEQEPNCILSLQERIRSRCDESVYPWSLKLPSTDRSLGADTYVKQNEDQHFAYKKAVALPDETRRGVVNRSSYLPVLRVSC